MSSSTTTTANDSKTTMNPQQQQTARELVLAWGAAVDALRDAEDALDRLGDAIAEMVPGDYPRWLPSKDTRERANQTVMGLEIVIRRMREELASEGPVCSRRRQVSGDEQTDRASVIITNRQRAELGLPPIGEEEAVA